MKIRRRDLNQLIESMLNEIGLGVGMGDGDLKYADPDIHNILAVMSVIDPTMASDLADAIVYYIEGKPEEAALVLALSAGGIGAGALAVKLGKGFKAAGKNADEAVEMGEDLAMASKSILKSSLDAAYAFNNKLNKLYDDLFDQVRKLISNDNMLLIKELAGEIEALYVYVKANIHLLIDTLTGNALSRHLVKRKNKKKLSRLKDELDQSSKELENALISINDLDEQELKRHAQFVNSMIESDMEMIEEFTKLLRDPGLSGEKRELIEKMIREAQDRIDDFWI